MCIDTIWKNIQLHEGDTFKTVRGIEYTYTYYSDYLLVNNDKRRRITKSALISALTIQDPTPSKIEKEGIWAPSYIYGIITDVRIQNR